MKKHLLALTIQHLTFGHLPRFSTCGMTQMVENVFALRLEEMKQGWGWETDLFSHMALLLFSPLAAPHHTCFLSSPAPSSVPAPYHPLPPHLTFSPPCTSLFCPLLSAFSHMFSPPAFHFLPPHCPCFHRSSRFAVPL